MVGSVSDHITAALSRQIEDLTDFNGGILKKRAEKVSVGISTQAHSEGKTQDQRGKVHLIITAF